MGFYDKIVSIKDGKVNTIHNTSGEGISNSGVSFLAMAVYCKDALLGLTTLGQKGFKTYGLGSSLPFEETDTDNETIEANKFGYGSINYFLKTGEVDSSDLMRKYYFPFTPISANYNMEEEAIAEHIGDLKTETENGYNYTYIIDFDKQMVRLISYGSKPNARKNIDVSFLELGICKNNITNEKSLLKRVLGNDFRSDIVDMYIEQKEHYLKCGADNMANFKEIVLNNIYIFNNSYTPMEIKELLEDFIK